MTPGIALPARRALVAIAIGLTAITAVGGPPTLAQAPDPTPLPGASLPLPIECSELEARTDTSDVDGDGFIDDCVDFYVEREVLAPARTTTTTVAGNLPQTGSGVSPVLAIGTVLLIGGGTVVAATRRRSRAPSH